MPRLVALALPLATAALCAACAGPGAPAGNDSPGTSTATDRLMPTPGKPTLGVRWAPTSAGFGEVAPKRIFLGGDPTGDVTDIHWMHWGGATATGTGTSTYVADDQTVSQSRVEPVTITAFRLGTCGGHPAYRAVQWTFPRHGSSAASRVIDTCVGP